MPNEFRLADYLKRIGFDGKAAPDLATLAALHAAQVDAIPYESLDPLLRRGVSLDLASLQEKLIDRRRGGYCYEQNGLFKAALEAIGFRLTALGARVRWSVPAESPLGPKVHMLVKVDLKEGSYLADVGFGSSMLDAPLQFTTDIEQRTAMGTYRLSEIDGLYSLSAKQPEGWRTMYAFDMAPQIQSDYELGNWFTSTHPRSPFTSKLIMERLTRDKRYRLVNRRLTVELRDGELAEQHIIASADELLRVIDQIFGVTPPVPIEEIFARIES